MKKGIVLVGLLVMLCFFVSTVSAVAYQTRIGLIIQLNESYSEDSPTNGYFDILFLIEENDYRFSNTIQSLFKETYPTYETFSYLSNTEWKSFLAYGGTDSYTVVSQDGKVLFYSHAFNLQSTDQLKVVKVDDSGQIEAESDVITFDNQGPFESLDVRMNYDLDTLQFEVTSIYGIRLLYTIFIVALILGVSMVLFLSRFGLFSLFKSLHQYEKRLNQLYLFTTVPLSLLFVAIGVVYINTSVQIWMGIGLMIVLLMETVWIGKQVSIQEDRKNVFIANYATLIPYGLILLLILI